MCLVSNIERNESNFIATFEHSFILGSGHLCACARLSLVDFGVKMVKVNEQHVKQENRRIVIINPEHVPACKKAEDYRRILHSLISRRMQLIKLAMVLVLVAVGGTVV